MKVDETLKIESMYDPHFDVLGIRVVDDYKYKESVELEEGIILDFDENNSPVALEILDASKVLKISKKQFLDKKTCIHMNICISDEVILVKLTVSIEIHNRKASMPIDLSAINNINAPVMQTELLTA